MGEIIIYQIENKLSSVKFVFILLNIVKSILLEQSRPDEDEK